MNVWCFVFSQAVDFDGYKTHIILKPKINEDKVHALTAEEFVERLLQDEDAERPTDECKASDLELSLPPWYDEDKYKLGSRFFLDNFYGHVAAHFVGLVTVMAIPSILKVLVHTRRSSSAYTAYRRYASTVLHIIEWQSGVLKPGTRAWKSILEVRRRHLNASKNAVITKVGNVSQRDVALTQYAFIALLLLHPDKFGIVSYDERSWEGFNHMWRTLIYMIGLKDKYNICLGTVDQSTKICTILMKKVFAPHLEFPPEHYEHMAYVSIDGIWSVLPLIEPKGAVYIARRFAGVPGYVYTQQELIDFRKKITNGELETTVNILNKEEPQLRPKFDPKDYHRLEDVPAYKKLYLWEKIKMNTILFLFSFYSTRLGKIILNYLLRFFVYLTVNFPVLAFVRWGVSKSWVNIFEESIGDRTKPMANDEVRKMLSVPPWYHKFISFK